MSAQAAALTVEPKRHLGEAVISFNDGHSEARNSRMINPPANPAQSPDSASACGRPMLSQRFNRAGATSRGTPGLLPR
jgi:hypothetical protein